LEKQRSLTSIRNLLVSSSKDVITLKVADFGLAQHLSPNFHEYTKLDGDELLPIRWTAVEVLKTHKVTQKSDVWSFGMIFSFEVNIWRLISGATMYEILELAVPFYQIVSTQKVASSVINGLRLDRPTSILPSDELWAILQSCWLEPDQRPSFQEIHYQLSLLAPSESERLTHPLSFIESYNWNISEKGH
jgi:serine/threonine protein kinase